MTELGRDMKYSKPSTEYLLELDQVASAADRLKDFLADNPNMLPLGFPTGSVLTLCVALSQLPRGSVEGSVILLETGREQYPNIRRNFIPQEPDGSEVDPEIPPVFRGGDLDKMINDLYVAIGTAIDEYKSEYGDDFEDGISKDQPIERRSEFGLEDSSDKTKRAEEAIEELNDQLATRDQKKSEEEARFNRALVDTDSELKAARATASMPHPKPNLLSRLGTVISKAPEGLIATGRAAQIASDAGQPIVDASITIWLGAWNAVLETVTTAGKAIEESGKRLRQWRDGDKFANRSNQDRGTTDLSQLLNPDELCISILRGEGLPSQLYPLIEELEFQGTKHLHWLDVRKSCEIISKCSNLKLLNLTSSPIQDLSFLKGLTNLKNLVLSSTEVIDLEPLVYLRSLEQLNLNGARHIVDISVLQYAKELQDIGLRNTSVVSLTPLFELPNLEFIDPPVATQVNGQMRALQERFQNLTEGKSPKRKRGRRGGKRVRSPIVTEYADDEGEIGD